MYICIYTYTYIYTYIIIIIIIIILIKIMIIINKLKNTVFLHISQTVSSTERGILRRSDSAATSKKSASTTC